MSSGQMTREDQPKNAPRYKRVFVSMEQDEDGYPPDTIETLWAFETSGLYTIDNIPFFAKGISLGDVVETNADPDGELAFVRVLQPSMNSIFRISVTDPNDRDDARRAFLDLGCESEGSHIPTLFALVVPGELSISPVIELIDQGLASARWEVEEGALRHQLPS